MIRTFVAVFAANLLLFSMAGDGIAQSQTHATAGSVKRISGFDGAEAAPARSPQSTAAAHKFAKRASAAARPSARQKAMTSGKEKKRGAAVNRQTVGKPRPGAAARKAAQSRSTPQVVRQGRLTSAAAYKGVGRSVQRAAVGPASARYTRRVVTAVEQRRAGRYRGPSFVPMPPAVPVDEDEPRSLSFFHVHSRESITATFWRDGQFVQSALDQLNAFLRDSHDES
ncbi:MAG TPA: DUF882 domain-containing protein, partial [Vineibacter sp.]|nr:DUF882 domain-containing protein [Vineibacter sp.]